MYSVTPSEKSYLRREFVNVKVTFPIVYQVYEHKTFLDRRDRVPREYELSQQGDVVGEGGGGHGRDGVVGEVEAVEVGEAAEGVGRHGAEAAAGEVQLLQVVQVPRGEGVVAEPGEDVAGEDQHLGPGLPDICTDAKN